MSLFLVVWDPLIQNPEVHANYSINTIKQWDEILGSNSSIQVQIISIQRKLQKFSADCQFRFCIKQFSFLGINDHFSCPPMMTLCYHISFILFRIIFVGQRWKEKNLWRSVRYFRVILSWWLCRLERHSQPVTNCVANR